MVVPAGAVSDGAAARRGHGLHRWPMINFPWNRARRTRLRMFPRMFLRRNRLLPAHGEVQEEPEKIGSGEGFETGYPISSKMTEPYPSTSSCFQFSLLFLFPFLFNLPRIQVGVDDDRNDDVDNNYHTDAVANGEIQSCISGPSSSHEALDDRVVVVVDRADE